MYFLHFDYATEQTLIAIWRFFFTYSALKPLSWNGFWGIQRGRYDLNKPENITDRYRQSNRTTLKKNSVIRITRKPLEPGLKLKIHLLAKFCHPSCDMKFTDPREKSESLCFKTNDTKELKTQGA